MKKLNIAIIGQGRSGRGIHGAHFKSQRNTLFNVAYVVEIDEKRRNRAKEEYPGVQVFDNYEALYGIEDIDLVLNSTMSKDHYAITKELLEHGFNVVVEKPFARTRYECDDLIRIARERGLILAVFQQSLLVPYYLGAKEVIASGKLGEIKQIDITMSGFSRRWDWQTCQKMVGGNIYNTGPHPIGFALGFLDFDPEARVVFSRLGHVLSSGDADDYAKIIVTAPNKPVIDLEISSNDAFASPDIIKIIGSRGTYKCGVNNYEIKYIVDGENPERELVLTPYENDKGMPAFCSEKLSFHEESGAYIGNGFDVAPQRFYEMMYEAIVNGKELEVKPEYASMIIGVIEAAHAQSPLPVKF